MSRTRRPDLGRQRWIARAVDEALWLLREGRVPHRRDAVVTPENAPQLGMERVLLTWENEGGGIKLATARAAERNWDAWTADVAAEVARILSAPGAAERQAQQARLEAERDAEIRAMAARAHARWDREAGCAETRRTR